tara:strand:- start:6068 stop:6235 length:168 start_codon:yes stop_codon:yes gene_type:complete
MAPKVRILLFPPIYKKWVNSLAVKILDCESSGRGFESHFTLQNGKVAEWLKAAPC